MHVDHATGAVLDVEINQRFVPGQNFGSREVVALELFESGRRAIRRDRNGPDLWVVQIAIAPEASGRQPCMAQEIQALDALLFVPVDRPLRVAAGGCGVFDAGARDPVDHLTVLDQQGLELGLVVVGHVQAVVIVDPPAVAADLMTLALELAQKALCFLVVGQVKADLVAKLDGVRAGCHVHGKRAMLPDTHGVELLHRRQGEVAVQVPVQRDARSAVGQAQQPRGLHHLAHEIVQGAMHGQAVGAQLQGAQRQVHKHHLALVDLAAAGDQTVLLRGQQSLPRIHTARDIAGISQRAIAIPSDDMLGGAGHGCHIGHRRHGRCGRLLRHHASCGDSGGGRQACSLAHVGQDGGPCGIAMGLGRVELSHGAWVGRRCCNEGGRGACRVCGGTLGRHGGRAQRHGFAWRHLQISQHRDRPLDGTQAHGAFTQLVVQHVVHADQVTQAGAGHCKKTTVGEGGCIKHHHQATAATGVGVQGLDHSARGSGVHAVGHDDRCQLHNGLRAHCQEIRILEGGDHIPFFGGRIQPRLQGGRARRQVIGGQQHHTRRRCSMQHHGAGQGQQCQHTHCRTAKNRLIHEGSRLMFSPDQATAIPRGPHCLPAFAGRRTMFAMTSLVTGPSSAVEHAYLIGPVFHPQV